MNNKRILLRIKNAIEQKIEQVCGGMWDDISYGDRLVTFKVEFDFMLEGYNVRVEGFCECNFDKTSSTYLTPEEIIVKYPPVIYDINYGIYDLKGNELIYDNYYIEN